MVGPHADRGARARNLNQLPEARLGANFELWAKYLANISRAHNRHPLPVWQLVRGQTLFIPEITI